MCPDPFFLLIESVRGIPIPADFNVVKIVVELVLVVLDRVIYGTSGVYQHWGSGIL
jgi:hypothetical protein